MIEYENTLMVDRTFKRDHPLEIFELLNLIKGSIIW